MITHRAFRWWCASAGCWCLACLAELAGQWRLLTPRPLTYFGQPAVSLVMAAYLCCGLVLAPPILAIRVGMLRWMLLLAPPAFLGTAGLLFPEGGLAGPRGALLAVGVALAAAAAAGALRRRTPSPALGLFVFLAVVPLALSLPERPPAPPAPASAPRRRNLVLVTLDTLRPDHLGLSGYPRATSPGLDSLAAAGRLFTTAYAPAPSTSPSHASILTGVSPSTHGVRRKGWPLGAQAATLGEALASAGYMTGGVVSVAHLAGGFGWSRGFSWFHDRGRLDGLFPYSGVRIIRMILRVVPMDFSCRAEVSISRALAWLQRIDEPFFLWVHLWDPHDPYAPPPPYDTMFTGQVPLPEASGYDASQVSTWVNGYDGEIRYADAQLGRLWRFLRDRGLDSRTVVAVLSDHGESLGERSYQGHSILLYDEQVRVLFIMAGPGIEPAWISIPVSLVDVMPTVLAALGVPPAGPMEGRPLLCPDLGAHPLRFDVDMWGFHGRGVRLGSRKLAVYDRVNPAHRGFAMSPGHLEFLSGTELYEVGVDPAETANLAASAPDRVAALAELLESGERAGASVPLPPALERALRSLGYVE